MELSTEATFLLDTPDHSTDFTTDIDQFSVTVPVSTYSRMATSPFELLLRDLVGATITLSTEQSKRNLRDVLADHLILAFHPVIISTRPLRHLKENIIHHCTSLGRPVFPSTSLTTIAAQTRPLDLNTFHRLLNRCNITYVTLTSYGMKCPILFSPLTYPYHEQFIASSDHMQHGYNLNTFDISFTCRSSTLHTIRVRHTNVTTHTLFTPLDHRRAPSSNHGGSFKLILADISNAPTCLSLSTYNPLHHWVAAYPGSFAPPASFRAGQEMLTKYDSLLTALENSPTPVGGLRHEIRTSSPTPMAALDLVMATRPWKLNNADYFSIPLSRYFPTARDLLRAARSELESHQFHFSHRLPPLGAPHVPTLAHKQIFGDLKQLFGEATYAAGHRSDAIDPQAWWRRRYPLTLPVHPDPDLVILRVIDPPRRTTLPDNDATNTLLCTCVDEIRRANNNRCNWTRLEALFNRRLRGATSYPKSVLKSRYRTLLRRQ